MIKSDNTEITESHTVQMNTSIALQSNSCRLWGEGSYTGAYSTNSGLQGP